MANLNHVVLIGRLTKDSELKYTNTGLAISRFSLAVNRRKKSGDQRTEEVSFFDITIFGKTAENLSQYLIKGKEIAVEGELRQNRWTDDHGQNHSSIGVVGNTIQLLGGRKNESERNKSRYDDEEFYDDIPF